MIQTVDPIPPLELQQHAKRREAMIANLALCIEFLGSVTQQILDGWMDGWILVDVYIYIYTCTLYTHTYTYPHVYISIYLCVCIGIYIYIYIDVDT